MLSTVHHRQRWMAEIYKQSDRLIDRLLASDNPLMGRARLRDAIVGARHLASQSEMKVPTRLLSHVVRHAAVQLLEQADLLHVLGPSEAEWLEEDFNVPIRKTLCMPNGVDKSFLAARETDRPGPRWDVVVIGRLERRKQTLELVKALGSAGVRSAFIGATNQNEARYVEEVLRTARKFSTIEIAGPRPHPEISGILRRSRLHCQMGLAEVLPLVDLEAMALGCRVLATTRSCLADWSFSAGAIFVDPRELSPETVIAALEDERMGQSKLKTIETLPSWDAIGARLVAAYEDVAQP